MDFYQILENTTSKGVLEIYPDFIVRRSKDLMVRGRSFYAIWDAEKNLWSTDEYDVQRLVDAELEEYKNKRKESFEGTVQLKKLSNFSSKMWTNYRTYMNQMSDNSHQLDENLTFLNTKVKKTDYISRMLPYPLEEGSMQGYEEIMSTLYEPEERKKLEWAIGAIVSGDSKNIQKFIVLYGEMGSGKSTFLNIVQKLFEGYYVMFDAKFLTSANNAFSTEVFKSNPLVAIQHDGDLSKIEDNTKLNSIASHEFMTMNEKYKPSYTARVNALLFMGTNKAVRITDAKSGIIRRLIDTSPSGRKIPNRRYHTLMSMIDFELGAIAYHCLQIYKNMGANYYSSYRPLEMMLQTDVFFNFVEANYHIFKEQDEVTLTQAYEMYKAYCDETLVDFKLPRHKFREELKSYFSNFKDYSRIEGKTVRSCYSGFISEKFSQAIPINEEKPSALVLDSKISILDKLLANCPAQYSTINEIPEKKWDEVTTKLSDINTKEIHYVKVPTNHIVIDFDLKDKTGEKSLDLNLEAASKWPITYAEYSKSGNGVHLHYTYDGAVTKLSRVYSDGIEVKVFTGKSSLRRRLTKCNNIPVSTIKSGLPLKGEKPMIDFKNVMSEKTIRNQIASNLCKEVHPGTKPSIDFIYKILDDAYKSGTHYDVSDMRQKVLTFAMKSTNQSDYCIKRVGQMQFASEEISTNQENYDKDEIIFYDVEVFPNLFIVVWKAAGPDKTTVKMINPTPQEIEEILKMKLVGFNCRRYDNHILYARLIGCDNDLLYALSQKIINNSRSALFNEAYNLSYTDVFDFSSIKQSLKKFQLDLGIHHRELGLPWDQPVPEERWQEVADYCVNDVVATEAVFDARKQDFVARQILAELSGLKVNDTTQMHTAKILFGNDKRPQDKFIYTDLSDTFPGYVYDCGKSSYKDEDPSEGGYVYAEPGMYTNVAVLDVASMHPTSLIQMNMFGPYTKNYKDLLNARIFIKHKDYDTAATLLGGVLAKYLTNTESSKELSYALKIILNCVYGYTSASFENKFRDRRNKDNIVAKRGALFMIDLKYEVQARGFTVAHIKTDSIKIPDATPEIIDFVFKFGEQYGYTFEHEETYEKFCLVNNAVFIALSDTEHKTPWGTMSRWTGTGAQFNPETSPYVFKKLFSHEPIAFEDMCEGKTVTTALYLDMNERLGEDEHNYHFVGKVGLFTPILSGCGGGLLMREKDGKYYAATGSKGYRWLEAELVKSLSKEADVDEDYYRGLVDDAVEAISKYGNIEWFIDDIDDPIGTNEKPPWCDKCNHPKCSDCSDCTNCSEINSGFNCEQYDKCPFDHECLPF